MFLGKFQTGLYIALLSRGTLQALQDFSPLRRSVTNGLLDDCGPNCLEIINKLLPCSSGLIPHFSRSSLPHEVRSCMELQTEGDWWLFVFLPFPNNLSNSCLLLTKLLADGLVAILALCRSTILSLTSFDSSLVLPMVAERLEWKIQILRTGQYVPVAQW